MLLNGLVGQILFIWLSDRSKGTITTTPTTEAKSTTMHSTTITTTAHTSTAAITTAHTSTAAITTAPSSSSAYPDPFEQKSDLCSDNQGNIYVSKTKVQTIYLVWDTSI